MPRRGSAAIVDVSEALQRDQADDVAFRVDRVEGRIPDGLDGVLFRNGGGIFTAGDAHLSFLDGYGLVGALEVADGAAFLRTSHPETPVLIEERRAGRMTRRRVFTNLPGWRRNVFNVDPTTTAAHDSYVWNGQLHAADLGRHAALSLPELKTVGETPWRTNKGELTAPMPREDPVTDTLVTYVLRQTAIKSEVTFVEVDGAFQEVARSQTVRTDGLIHDLAFTEDWYVLVENAAKPRPLPALLGRAPLWTSFAWDGRPPTLLFIPRKRAGEPVRIPMTGTSLQTVFHIVNVFAEGDEVVVDVTGYDGPVSFDALMVATRDGPIRLMPTNHVARVRAAPLAGGSADVQHFEGASGEAPEIAPALQGRPYSCVWYAAVPSPSVDPNSYVFTSRMGRLDVATGTVTTWDAGADHQLSPPAFAPDPAGGPEDGWVLAWDLDLTAETADVVILDAGDLAAGPLARLHLGVYLPAVSHCRFAPGVRVSA
jgi:all-trans-8'-apo-beta-carotenal 15,15'-oxygenase